MIHLQTQVELRHLLKGYHPQPLHPHTVSQQPSALLGAPPRPPTDRLLPPSIFCTWCSSRKPFPFGLKNSSISAPAPEASFSEKLPSRILSMPPLPLPTEMFGEGARFWRSKLTSGPGRKPTPFAASVSRNYKRDGGPLLIGRDARVAPAGGGPGGRGGLRKSRPQEFGASTPYKDICSASQSAAGAALSPVPGRPPAARPSAGPAGPPVPLRGPAP